MKKTILNIIAIALIAPSVTLATSGACSYHGGVNCSAGASYTGKVQCNDGWTDSSVYFSDMQECKTTYSRCTYPSYSTCDVQNAITQAKNRAGMTAILNNQYGLHQPTPDWTQDNDYLLCKHTQELYQAGQDYYNKCIADESASAKIQLDNMMLGYQIKFNEACVKDTGPGSVYKDGKCVAPLKILNTTLPNAILNKPYSSDVKFSYDIQDGLSFNFSDIPDGIYFDFLNSNVGNNTFSVKLTPRKLGTFTFKANAMMNNLVFSTSILSLTVNNPTQITFPPQTITENKSTIDSIIFYRTLKNSSEGEDVKSLQQGLVKLGYLPSNHQPITYFGNMTKNALIKFQKDNGIKPAVGTFGPATQKVFNDKLNK